MEFESIQNIFRLKKVMKELRVVYYIPLIVSMLFRMIIFNGIMKKFFVS